jgi:hypothetical protein
MQVSQLIKGVTLAALLGCLLPAVTAAQCDAGPKNLIVVVDITPSITIEQREKWRPLISSAIGCVGPGGHVTLFAISGVTSDAAALFNADAPALPQTRTMSEWLAYVEARRNFFGGVKQALDQVLGAPPTGQVTDVFGLFDRIGHDPRPTELWLFSDILNLTDDLNLEKVRLRAPYQSAIQREAAAHGWTNATLRDVRVRVILPDAACPLTPGLKRVMAGPRVLRGVRPPVNSRADLAGFYGVLFSSLSAKLESFDTEVH